MRKSGSQSQGKTVQREYKPVSSKERFFYAGVYALYRLNASNPSPKKNSSVDSRRKWSFMSLNPKCPYSIDYLYVFLVQLPVPMVLAS